MDQDALTDNVVPQSGPCGQPQLLYGPISDFTTKYDLNNQFLALAAAVENRIISQQVHHRGFQTVKAILTVHIHNPFNLLLTRLNSLVFKQKFQSATQSHKLSCRHGFQLLNQNKDTDIVPEIGIKTVSLSSRYATDGFALMQPAVS